MHQKRQKLIIEEDCPPKKAFSQNAEFSPLLFLYRCYLDKVCNETSPRQSFSKSSYFVADFLPLQFPALVWCFWTLNLSLLFNRNLFLYGE